MLERRIATHFSDLLAIEELLAALDAVGEILSEIDASLADQSL
jgi:hypothetical protein